MSQTGEPSGDDLQGHFEGDFEAWCSAAEPELRRLAFLLTGQPGAARQRVLAALVAARSAGPDIRDEAALRQLLRPHPDSSAPHRVVQAADSQTKPGSSSPDQRQGIVWDLLSTMPPPLRTALVMDVYAGRPDLVADADVTAGLEDLAAVLVLPLPAARELTAQTLAARARHAEPEPTTYDDVVRAAGHRQRRRWRRGALAAAAAVATIVLGATLLPTFGLPDPAPLPEPTTVSDEQESTAYDPDRPYPPPWVAPPGEEPISSKTKFDVLCAQRSDAEFRSRTVVRAGCKSIPHKR